MRKRTKSNNHYSTNDKFDYTWMPIEGTEALRSFSDGTGIRKYDKNDPSVIKMRKERTKTYAKFGIGFGLAAQSQDIPYHSNDEIIADFINGRRVNINIKNIKSINYIKIILYKITKIPLTDNIQINNKLNITISNATLKYELIIEKQDDGFYRMNLKKIGIVKHGKRITLLDEMRRVKNRKMRNKKFVPRNKTIKHANNIRGIDTLSVSPKNSHYNIY